LQYTKEIMKTEEKNSNVPKVRIAVLGQMNVGKSG
jgi:ribosome biogenesis GTPase A